MSAPKICDDEFIETFRRLGPSEASRKLGIDPSNLHRRRRSIEQKYGISIEGPGVAGRNRAPHPELDGEIKLEIENGIVLVASDAHYWPGQTSLMHRTLVKFCKELRPRIFIFNGDVMDFPSISRHDPLMWEKRPAVNEEIEFAQGKLHEIALVLPRGARKLWTFGNHDQRFESRLAIRNPEYAKLNGFHLKDYFPAWEPCMSVLINQGTDGETQVKHRFRGGQNATDNNAKASGRNCVTGHLHNPNVAPFTFGNGLTVYGVDTGCVADTYARPFSYLENSPRNWRSSFGVLTYREGRLLQPELVLSFDDKRVQFRGELLRP